MDKSWSVAGWGSPPSSSPQGLPWSRTVLDVDGAVLECDAFSLDCSKMPGFFPRRCAESDVPLQACSSIQYWCPLRGRRRFDEALPSPLLDSRRVRGKMICPG